MADFIITEAVPEDPEGILQVQRIGWSCAYPNDDLGITRKDIQEHTNAFTISHWAENIKQLGEKSKIFVAKIGGKIVGFSGGQKDEKYNRVRAVYVDPAVNRGGIGSALLIRFLDFLGNTKSIAVEVVEYNQQAINFYTKFGFKKERNIPVEQVHAKLPSGKSLPEIEMIKKPI